jgi:hypothetical protein
MGGLVSRYYLEVLGGWRDTRTLITFGTPYRGSLNAVDFLALGFKKFFGLVDLTDVMRSFTSVYQLLPIYPCLDIGDGKLLRLTEAPGLVPGLDPDAVTAARQFHAEIEDAVAQHANDTEYVEHGYRIRSVIGIEQPTNQSAVWSGGALSVLRTYDGKDLGGDGTVPRVSASPQEVKSDERAMFASTKHASLQNTDAVLTQIRGWVTGVDLGTFKVGAPITLSVDMDDVYPMGAPVRVRVQPSSPTLDLHFSLTWVAGPTTPSTLTTATTMPLGDGPREAELLAPAPGCYSVHVSGSDDVEPVTDLVVVAPA